jgi:hypothetical protein
MAKGDGKFYLILCPTNTKHCFFVSADYNVPEVQTVRDTILGIRNYELFIKHLPWILTTF